MATVFDRGSLWLLSMMRRYAAVRLVLLLYVVWLQLWALFMLDWAMDMEQECALPPSRLGFPHFLTAQAKLSQRRTV